MSYNTRELLAHLLFSLFRVLPFDAISTVVVVDNGSTDGTLDLLRALAAAGRIELVERHRRPYHGPGLNRGLSQLARRQRLGTAVPIDHVWILDSDVVVLRPEALSHALRRLQDEGAVLAGQLQPYDQRRPSLDHYAHPSSLLLDPAQVWRHRIPPFLEDGAPGVMMQHSLRRRGMQVLDFPWFRSRYLLHLGRGTLAALARDGQRQNRYYEWALKHSAPNYHGDPAGRDLHAAFVARFRQEVPDLTPAAFVAASLRPDRVTVEAAERR